MITDLVTCFFVFQSFETVWQRIIILKPVESNYLHTAKRVYVPWSKVAILGMVIPPLIGILIINGYINLYYWVDDQMGV